MSDVTHLRKLTRKSFLNFGKYADWTVQNIIDKEKKGYLRWVYYNCSKIDFSEDVLQEIFKYDFIRLNKPDKKPEYLDAYNEKIKENTSEIGLKIIQRKTDHRFNKEQKAKLCQSTRRERIYYSKASMQRRNQGK